MTVGSALAGLSNNGNPSSVIMGIIIVIDQLSVIIGGINGIILEGLNRATASSQHRAFSIEHRGRGSVMSMA